MHETSGIYFLWYIFLILLSKFHRWRHNHQIISVQNSIKYENHVKIICVGVNQLLANAKCSNSYNRGNFQWIFHFCWNRFSKRCQKLNFGFFSILRGRGITWVDLFCSEMKENFFLHILVPIWVFKMVYKSILVCKSDFQNLRRRAYAWVISGWLQFSVWI